MKYLVLILFCILILTVNGPGQTIKGELLKAQDNITIVKVWGDHQERGYAQGFLLAEKIESIIKNYIFPKFGGSLSYAKSVLSDTANFKIDSAYIEEAKSVAQGMADAGYTGYDYIDVLVANSLLDLSGILSEDFDIDFKLGCSSLVSWGDATIGTSLNGKTAISRHLDWEVNQYLINNQTIVIHIPSEPDEQPWIMVGFAGQIAVLSGFNESGVSAFQHVLSGISGNATSGKEYIPIWFALRKGLETKDFNSDGKNNTEDIKDALLTSQNGFAACCIISSAASSTNIHDSLIALVSEVTHTAPYHTFRCNSYDDMIPGDNLYAANSAIARNNVRQYCSRYYSLAGAIETGVNIDSLKNWTLLRDYSRAPGINIQFMQVIPELNTFKISGYKSSSPAYAVTPYIYKLDTLFQIPTHIEDKIMPVDNYKLFQNYPNPFNPVTTITFSIPQDGKVELKVYDVLGNEVATLVNEYREAGSYKVGFNGSTLSSGIYFYTLSAGSFIETKKLAILK
ncbi:MAG TPA: T9SS type A sorting domain-containing protein [Ignavibacteriaceae bacterium]|nr:T9SS type A sorting domain-containing protein [Ignavibacteriaceae bacterium]